MLRQNFFKAMKGQLPKQLVLLSNSKTQSLQEVVFVLNYGYISCFEKYFRSFSPILNYLGDLEYNAGLLVDVWRMFRIYGNFYNNTRLTGVSRCPVVIEKSAVSVHNNSDKCSGQCFFQITW